MHRTTGSKKHLFFWLLRACLPSHLPTQSSGTLNPRPPAPGARLHHLARGLIPAGLPQVVHKQQRLRNLLGQRGAKGLEGEGRTGKSTG